MSKRILPNLSKYQWFGVVFLSLNFWYTGILLVNAVQHYLYWSLSTLLLLCVLNVPFALLSIRGTVWILRLSTLQRHPTIILITFAVSALHIIAFLFFSPFYEVTGIERTHVEIWLTVFSTAVIVSSYFLSSVSKK